MIEIQDGTRCGVHAISNLLQMKLDSNYVDFLYPDPINNPADREVKIQAVLKLITEALDDALKNELKRILTKLLSLSPSACQQDGSMLSIKEVNSLLLFVITNESGANNTTNYEIKNILFTEIQSTPEYYEHLIGFIENDHARTHYTAWILKNNFWYNIDSIGITDMGVYKGTIKQYKKDDAEKMFIDRAKTPNMFETVFLLSKNI